MSRLISVNSKRYFSKTSKLHDTHSCKLLIVGGGAGGCTVAAKLANNFKKHEIIVVEPAEYNYYQPLFTLIGGGTKTISDARKPMGQVLPKNVTWVQDAVREFSPKENCVSTGCGHTIKYDFMLIATGLQLNYDKIPGLLDALKQKDSGVCSNYSELYVEKTFESLKRFKKGNAIFTLPNTPLKCPGAPQKAAYIADAFFRKNNKRNNARVIYNTSLPVIFGVKKYADALWKVVEGRDIDVNLRTNLVSIEPGKNVATFENLEKPGETHAVNYEMLNVTPPMCTPNDLRKCRELVNDAGFVDVNKDTMQSTKFDNVFAIGDCASSPNSKTCAAVASQSTVIAANMTAVMSGNKPEAIYNGYASCPLVTGYDKCILAEFDYNLTPMETFPFNQARELRSMYIMKRDIMPTVYWLMLRGYWGGPATMRKFMRLGFA